MYTNTAILKAPNKQGRIRSYRALERDVLWSRRERKDRGAEVGMSLCLGNSWPSRKALPSVLCDKEGTVVAKP